MEETNMRTQIRPWIRVLGILIGVTILLLAGCSSVPSQYSVPETSPGLAADKASDEGITVHGHWTIEVRNPDGTLVERREFNNALHHEGAPFLSRILGRQNSVGGWVVHLAARDSADSAFLRDDFTPHRASLVESTREESPYSNIFRNLTVSVPDSGDDMNKFVLSGTATAQRDGTIELVQTVNNQLPSTEPPSGNYGGIGAEGFTSTYLPSPVILTTGQQVMAKVVISFSS